MSDSKKTFDLPTSTRRRDGLVVPPTVTIESHHSREIAGVQTGGFTDAQMDKIIEGSFATVSEAFGLANTIASGYFEILKIREQSTSDIGKIDAETRKIEAQMAGEVRKLVAQKKTIRARGDTAVAIIQMITQQLSAIPDTDAGSRRLAIENLPRIIELALANEGAI